MAESSNKKEAIETIVLHTSFADKDKEKNDVTNLTNQGSSSIVLSPKQLENKSSVTRRHVSPTTNIKPIITIGDDSDNEDELEKRPRLERRKIFNLVKYFLSIVLVLLDIAFDWVEYFEMDKRGNYSIVAERRIRNIEFTAECQGTGKTIQFVFLIFTIVATVLSVLQIINIIYQLFYEFKSVTVDKRLVHEFIETFVFLLFIEISQMFLIMGFHDVCTLDCDINATEIFIATNGLISYLKVFWRFCTSCSCCSSHLTTKRRRKVQFAAHRGEKSLNCCGVVGIILLSVFFPIALPFICIYCICESKESTHGEKKKWKCEQSCKCCILRCFPSRFEDTNTKACDCMCKKWMSCERSCKCCSLRCFPKYLPTPLEDICECTCGKCMRGERNCLCCILRCFPSYLEPPKSDYCTCRCADCLACELPCECFTFRCFPKHLKTPKTDVWTCRCRECLSCKLPCKCFILRCFPEYQSPQGSDWFQCTCGDCMKCERLCGCCILRCFPSYFDSNDHCTCICRKFLACEKSFGCCIFRCFPGTLDSSKREMCECTCGQCLTRCKICTWCNTPKVHPAPPVTVQPQPQTPPPPPPPPPPRPRNNCSKCIAVLLGVVAVFDILLLLFYAFFEVVQIRFVLLCVTNDTLMLSTQDLFVQNYLQLYTL